jgi:hypothetical protein
MEQRELAAFDRDSRPRYFQLMLPFVVESGVASEFLHS